MWSQIETRKRHHFVTSSPFPKPLFALRARDIAPTRWKGWALAHIMPQDLAETRLLTARSSRRRRRFAPRTASLLDWTGMQSILSSLQTETARLALRWPASHLAAQRCVGTALNAEELHAAAAFQRGVDARRSPIESALRVLVASAGERVPPNMSVPGCVVISSVDGASMPASLPVASDRKSVV